MLYFNSDYMEGAHPKILERLSEINYEKNTGYGLDPYCDSAAGKIRALCGCPGAEVSFLVGGTQTNSTVIDGLLRAYQGVIAADTGHINVHEAGAIEFCGHKVMPLPNHNGKLDASELNDYLTTFHADGNWAHMVYPGMVYISHPTEYGTLYTAEELRALHRICRKFDIPLYLDGARLGYGLMARGTDVTLPVLGETCEAFYIGGTKVGALMGEAVVVTNEAIKRDFRYLMKRQGGMLAKGFLLGISLRRCLRTGCMLRSPAAPLRRRCVCRRSCVSALPRIWR